MMRNSIGKAIIAGCAAALMVAIALPRACGGQDRELIAPVSSETLQYRTEDFVIFFSPATEAGSLVGLRLSITSTRVDAMLIEWSESYFILARGERSDAVTNDIPTSFQMSPTDIYARQTVEIVSIPLSNVSLFDEDWSIAEIDMKEGDELTLHLAIGPAGALDAYDFTFRLDGDEEASASAPGAGLPVWSMLLALAAGALVALLVARL